MKRVISVFLVTVFIFAAIPFVAKAADIKESETNDDFSTADAISVNSTVSGALSHNMDLDFYKFTVSANGYVSLTFSHEYIDDNWNLWSAKIYNSSYEELMQRDFSGKDATNITTKLGISSGTYYIRVTGSSGYSDKQYDFKINYTASNAWETEINDEFSSADIVSVNSTVSGALSYNMDEDIYKFTVSANGYVSMTFSHEYINDTWSLWSVKIFNSSYEELMTRNFSGTDTLATTCNIGLLSGTYYICVISSSGYSDIQYNLKVNYVASNNWETEFNNDFNTADNILINTKINGSLMNSYDADIYSFTLSNNDQIKIQFDHDYIDDTWNYWSVILYDSSISEIMTIEINGSKTSTETDMKSLSSGKYYIKVKDSNGYSDIDYSLKVVSKNSAVSVFTVQYNGNGGNVSPSSESVSSGGYVTLPTPTRFGYTCLGWSATSSATSASFACGSKYKPTGNVILYAVWKKNTSEDKAVVHGISIPERVAVNYKDSWTIFPTIAADEGAIYSVKWESSNSSIVSVDQNGNLKGEKKGSATVTCTVTDSHGNSYSASSIVEVDYTGLQWFIIIVLFGWIWYI